MTGDPHVEPGRDEVRCDHGDGKGWGHPSSASASWAHACCGVVGHCPATDPKNFDHLPRGAVGDWEIETENGTRFVLTGLGTDDPRWRRIPGTPESSRAYSDRPYRLAALRARPEGEDTWGGDPVTVGHRMAIGVGQFSDLWHSSRVVWIRRLDDSRAARRLNIELVFADMRLDGIYPSERSVRDAEAYIAGEATLEELIERAKRDFGGGSDE